MAPTDLRAQYLSIRPIIERHGRIYFRHLKCGDHRADAIAEMLALCWKWMQRLHEQGKDATQFPTRLADFAARAVRCGRKVAGMNKAGDVMNPITQQRRGFVVGSLPTSTAKPMEDFYGNPTGQARMDAFEECLLDNTQTPVPDQVQFRVDFPAWVSTRTDRDRRIIDRMMHAERTKDIARIFGTSNGRISQLRREYHDDWNRFTEEK
jgi:hypothetical protein